MFQMRVKKYVESFAIKFNIYPEELSMERTNTDLMRSSFLNLDIYLFEVNDFQRNYTIKDEIFLLM